MTDNTETRTASSTGGEKGVKLARFDLIPTGPLSEVASRFGLGAMKYENRNWERGYEWSKSFGALMRHAQAFWSGEEDDDLGEEAFRAAGLDPDDFRDENGHIPGSSHLAAVVCHALFLLEWATTHPEFDDRVTTDRKRQADANRPAPEAQQHLINIPPTDDYTLNGDELTNNRTGKTITLDGSHTDHEVSEFMARRVPKPILVHADVTAEEIVEEIQQSLQQGLDRDQRSH